MTGQRLTDTRLTDTRPSETMVRRGRSAALRLPKRVQGRTRGADADRGAFAALELVILVPFVIVMMLMVVGFGRVERGRQLVDQAAEAASRAASLSINPHAAQTAAQQAAQQTLGDGGLSCSAVTVTVDTSAFYAGGQVSAHLACRADLSQLALAGLPGSTRLTADSTSPLEKYRQLGNSGSSG